MICKNCGAENPDYYVFCQNCFADLNESRESGVNASAPRDGAYQEPYPEEAYENPPSYGETAYDGSQPPVRPRPQQVPSQEGRPVREERRNSTRSQQQQSAPHYYGDERASQYEENAYYYEEDGVQDRMGEAAPAPRRPAATPPPAVRQNAPRRSRPQPPERPEGDMGIGNVVSQGISPRELRQRERQAQRDARELEKLATNAGAEYYDYYDYYDEAAVQREKHRSRNTGLIIGIIVVVVLAAAVVLGVLYANNTYGGVGAAIDSIFGATLGEGGEGVTVEAHTNEEGVVGHRIIIRAKKGQRIRFADAAIGQEYEVDSGEPRAFFVPDVAWIPEEPDENTPVLTVTPQIELVEKTGSATPLDVQSFEIPVPQCSLTITEPAIQQGNMAESGTLQISGQAASGNENPVKVLVHGYELTPGNLNQDGTFTCPVTLQGQDYSIDVVAKATRCRPMTVTLTGTLGGGGGAALAGTAEPGATTNANPAAGTASGALFTLDEGISLQTDQGTVTVTGQGPVGGMEFTVRGGAEITYDSATGRFSFVARLPELGMNTFVMQLDGQSQELMFLRTPNVNDYTESAVPLDFSYALQNQSEVFGKAYSFEGAVLEILEESPVYTFTVGLKDDPSKVVQVTYFGLDTPEIGKNFLIYASANGNAAENTRLRMNAYFMYSEELLAGLQSQSQ